MEQERLHSLIKKIQTNSASEEEKDEYMKYMLREGKISKEQYDKFKKGQTSDRFLKLVLILGGAILFGLGLNELTKKD